MKVEEGNELKVVEDNEVGVVVGIEAECPVGTEIAHDHGEHHALVEDHNQVEGVVDHNQVEVVVDHSQVEGVVDHILPGVVDRILHVEVVGEEVQSGASVVSVAWVRVQEVQTLVPLEFLPRGLGSRGTG